MSTIIDTVVKLEYNDSAFLIGVKQMANKKQLREKDVGNISSPNPGWFAGSNESKESQPTKIDSQYPVPDPAVGFANNGRKNTKDHKRHAKELGYRNQDEYERGAIEFFNGNEGKMFYSEARGRYYKYDEKTQRLVVSSNGIIHTFMKISKNKFERISGWDKLYEN